MKKITIAELSEIIGSSYQALTGRARREKWRPTGKRDRGCHVYDLERLPLTQEEMAAVQKYLRDPQEFLAADMRARLSREIETLDFVELSALRLIIELLCRGKRPEPLAEDLDR